MIIIKIHPESDKPEWMKIGAWCHCVGEDMHDVYRVVSIDKNTAFLITADGLAHGWESFTKLYRTPQELETRGRK